MHLAVLCLQRRREDQKLILLHAGGVYMSHSGTEVPALIYGIAESWHFYPAGHDQVDPMLYMHL